MGPHRLARAPSIQNTCIFCSLLLSASTKSTRFAPRIIGTKRARRSLHTTRSPSQSAAAVSVRDEYSENQRVEDGQSAWSNASAGSRGASISQGERDHQRTSQQLFGTRPNQTEPRSSSQTAKMQFKMGLSDYGNFKQSSFGAAGGATISQTMSSINLKNTGNRRNDGLDLRTARQEGMASRNLRTKRLGQDQQGNSNRSGRSKVAENETPTQLESARLFSGSNQSQRQMPDFFKPRQQKETPTQLEPKAGWGLGNIDTEPSEYESETAVEPTTGLVGRSSSTISPSWGRSALESTTASNENIQESTTTVKSSSDKDAHEFGNFEEGIQSRDNGQAVQSRKGGFTNDGRDYQPIAPPFDEDLAAGWQHLRRRNSVPLATQNGPSELAAQDHPFGSAVDVDWIDRSFEEHRQKREAATRSQPAAPESRQPTTTSPFASATANSKRCARCGELGHIARQCRSTVEMTCKVCQQPGHIARNCPTVGNSSSNVGQNTSPNRVIRYHAVEKTRRSSDNLSNVVQDISPSRIANPFTDERSEFSGASRSEKFASFRRTSTEGDVTRRDLRTSRYDLGDDSSIRENERLKSFDRKPSRRNSRNSYNDEDDEAGAAREDYQVRKQARRAQKEKEKQNSLREREIEWPTSIRLPEFVTVQRLSQMLGVRYEKFVRRLERLGYDDVFPGKVFNSETSGMIAMDYNIEPIFEADSPEDAERDLIARPEVEDKDFLQTRPPVVTIMGHVDHGKTTILDYLRKSSVAAGEAGGITQHIGAFSVPLASTGKTITFLDTPGHEAFLAMRQRGANVTDIVILVVAADDSVKPQTLEAIKHAKAAGVPIVVAINKIDKDGADADRCKKDLSRHGIDIEDYGGETQVVCVSGKTGQGMDDLEETVVALSEVLDHRADTEGAVEGWIIEATTKKAGRVATVLVRRGTLRPGCLLVAGKTWARVRTLQNEGGQTMHEIGPGMPVEIDGWKDQPSAGDEVLEAPNEQKATSVVEYRHEVGDRLKAASDMVTINETRKLAQERREREKQAEAEAKLKGAKVEAVSDNTAKADSDISGQISIPFIIKADVSGSAEAVSAYVLGVSNPLITPTILHSGVGAIHESDIDLASAASAHIIAFNLPANTESRGAAEAQGVKVLENNIIYRILDDVKAILEESLPPLISHKVLGEAEISASFDIGVGGRKKIWIAGCKVRNGVISRSEKVRVWRNGEKVYDGTINSLKNVKKDVPQMRKGTECGIGFDDWEGFQVGDQVQCYEELVEKRKL